MPTAEVAAEPVCLGPPSDRDRLPPLAKDPTFFGFTVTQFLGAFNDNLFKQLVLLMCLEHVLAGGRDYQGAANATFAVPFVLLSGFAGWLSDRTSKRRLIVICKVAEIGIMTAGIAAFFVGGLRPEARLYYLFAVLAMMSIHSTFFGPAKYGVLPELFRDRDLPATNGVVQMTTFLAIIFGTAVAGIGKDHLGADRLWLVSAACVAIAVAGTATSQLIRKTPVAQTGLRLRPSSLLIDSSVWGILGKDRTMLGVLLVSSLFWMVGGLVPLVVNSFGRLQLGLTDTRTSLMTACIGFGIAAGCVLAARLSRGRVRFGLVTIGAWGVIGCFALTIAIGWFGEADWPPAPMDESARELLTAPAPSPRNVYQWPAYPLMVALGVSAGLFAMPLQIFLQVRPPKELKGRMIGAMNFVNWVGIVLSAVLYQVLAALFRESRQYALIFAVAAVLLLPVALLYRPKDIILSDPTAV